MKYTLAIVALLGFATQETTAVAVSAERRHNVELVQESSESDSDSDAQNVALRCDGDDDDHSCEVFTPNMDGQVDGSYERVVTPRFDGDTDDLFMRSMIKTYANEKKNKDGSPSGAFIMTEGAARAASAEVLETHKGLAGAAKEAYLATYFPKAWKHFDVNQGGSIEVIKMPQFMRFLSSDQYMTLQP
jgi:hypothetical protein